LILSLLYRSLVRTGLEVARMRRQLDRRGERISLWTVLLAARLQEADGLVADHLRPNDQADRLIGRRLGGWAFHR
jgi:hypothetical protein